MLRHFVEILGFLPLVAVIVIVLGALWKRPKHTLAEDTQEYNKRFGHK